MSRLLSCLLMLLALAACDHATNSTNPGPPLATVHGNMTLGSGATVTGPVRLAVAWYTEASFGFDAPPKAAITQTVEYTGNFPQSFSFDLFEPPPPAAQMSNANQGKSSFGILVAYQDGNGNGQLDAVQNGPLADQVLATCAGRLSPFDPQNGDEWLIFWSDTAEQGLPKGFSVLKAPFGTSQPMTEVLAIETAQVPLVLSTDPRQGLWICAEAFDFSPQTSNVSCGLTRALGPPTLSAYGSIDPTGYLSFSASLYLGLRKVTHVTGTLNGKPLTVFEDPMGTTLFVLGLETDWLIAGSNTLTLSDGVDADQTVTFLVPQPFQVSAPLTGPVTVPFDVSWTQSANALEYRVMFARGTDQPLPIGGDATTSTMLSVVDALPTGDGNLKLFVIAEIADDTKQPQIQFQREQTVDLGP